MHEEKELILKDETYAVVGAAIEVHRELGPGFLEAVYQAALKIELANRLILFEAERLLPVHYKGQRLSTEYRADFICYNQIIVELKALDRLSGKEESQILNYLKELECESDCWSISAVTANWNGENSLTKAKPSSTKNTKWHKDFLFLLHASSCSSWINLHLFRGANPTAESSR